jgi:flagellar biosynthesis/type III secretory pathway chaperone
MTLVTLRPAPPAAAGPLEALVLCLEDEYGALLDEDYERLDAILARKQLLLARLADLPAAAVGAPQGDRARADALARRALQHVRELNHRNASVLAPRAAGNRARLQFLQSALGRGALYAADGSVPDSPPPAAGSRSA